jgi:hypothetical protein
LASFLLPQGKDAEAVTVFRDHVEIGVKAQQIFEELRAEKELLAKAVASLNTVRFLFQCTGSRDVKTRKKKSKRERKGESLGRM